MTYSMNHSVTNERFQPSWESLKQFGIPNWYKDAKFGIFIHWGVFSVPSFGNEWYPRNMYIQGSAEFRHHVATYGPHSQFGYKDFIKDFKMDKFDPDAWAAIFKQAGARYIVPVAEHHDGFAMYDSALSRWTATKLGPKRDLIGELAAAVRKQDMIFGLSNHRAEHWWYMNGGMEFDSDVKNPEYGDFYGPAKPGPRVEDRAAWQNHDWQPRPDAAYLEDWLARNCELVDKYQPQVVWFDWWIEQEVFEPYLQKFAAYYYNQADKWGKGAAINFKFGAFPDGTAVFDIERGQLSALRQKFWQTDTAVDKKSWGHISDPDYKSVDSIVDDLVDIVSKNGGLLLNIGPRADGTIPETEIEILHGIGDWLRINGEAIYGSRPWKLFGEGPTLVSEGAFTDTLRPAFTGHDIRFTTKENTLYAIALAWPGAECVIDSLGLGSELWSGEIDTISLLGHDVPLNWTREDRGLIVTMPDQKPCDHAFTLKITRN